MSISISHLTIGYPDYMVQSDLSLTLQAGEVVAMLGPNGCGKSTLLRTLAGLLPPISGTFAMGNHLYSSQSVALVLTSAQGLDRVTIHDVVAMGRYPYTSFLGHLHDRDEEVIANSLQAVGFTPNASLLSRGIVQCSDGDRQRVLIAKALAQQTPIILLDEPTAHLDLPNRIRTFQLLQRLAHTEGKTILISTHELHLALQMADRILLMSPNRGGVVLDTPDTLRKGNAFHDAFGMDVFCEIV